MPKKMSLKQVKANQQNAQKSTGPKTPAGLAVSKMNALKHGILSKEVLVRGLHRKESGRELAALHQRFWQELNPVGPVEEMLVDQIVTTHWRLRRALTAESGEIALSVDEGQWQRSRGKHPALQWMEWEVMGDPIHSMKTTAMGCRIVGRWLREVRAAVERDGELTEAAIKESFNRKTNSLTRELEGFRLKLQENSGGLDAAAWREKNRVETLAFLNKELSLLTWRETQCEEREEYAEQARQAAAVLPSMEVLDKILRYETKLERQMFRAMTQLERLQRMRHGEAVPAPLSVEVSERT